MQYIYTIRIKTKTFLSIGFVDINLQRGSDNYNSTDYFIVLSFQNEANTPVNLSPEHNNSKLIL